MIHQVTGDILLTKAQALAHSVAPNDHFDQGLAMALREKWPALAKDFRHYAHQTHPKPGEIWTWGGFGVRIFCLLAQEGDHGHGAKPGRASVANLNHCLRRLRHDVEQEQVESLALPRLCTGVGGLEWSEVEPLIRTHLGDLKIPIYLYTHYERGVAGEK